MKTRLRSSRLARETKSKKTEPEFLDSDCSESSTLTCRQMLREIRTEDTSSRESNDTVGLCSTATTHDIDADRLVEPSAKHQSSGKVERPNNRRSEADCLQSAFTERIRNKDADRLVVPSVAHQTSSKVEKMQRNRAQTECLQKETLDSTLTKAKRRLRMDHSQDDLNIVAPFAQKTKKPKFNQTNKLDGGATRDQTHSGPPMSKSALRPTLVIGTGTLVPVSAAPTRSDPQSSKVLPQRRSEALVSSVSSIRDIHEDGTVATTRTRAITTNRETSKKLKVPEASTRSTKPRIGVDYVSHENIQNPQEGWIFQIRLNEKMRRPDLDVIKIRQVLFTEQRVWLFCCLYNLGHMLNYERQTMHAALKYIDRYMTVYPNVIEDFEEIKLIGVTSVWIAGKVNEIQACSLSRIAENSDMSPEALKERELKMLRFLDFSVDEVTPYLWVEHYMTEFARMRIATVAQSNGPAINEYNFVRIMDIIDTATLENSSLYFLPSAIAATAVWRVLVEETEPPEIGEHAFFEVTRYTFGEIRDCYALMAFAFRLHRRSEPVKGFSLQTYRSDIYDTYRISENRFRMATDHTQDRGEGPVAIEDTDFDEEDVDLEANETLL